MLHLRPIYVKSYQNYPKLTISLLQVSRHKWRFSSNNKLSHSSNTLFLDKVSCFHDSISKWLLMRFIGDVKMWYFSVKHKLHLFDPLLYGLAWSITDQCMIGFSVPFLSFLRNALIILWNLPYSRTWRNCFVYKIGL